MDTLSRSLQRLFQLLRAPERSKIATIVGDPLQVRREINFLLLRAGVVCAIALMIISVAVLFIRRGVVGIEDRHALQQQLYGRFESMARLSHNVVEGRAALEAIHAHIPKDDNLVSFLTALDTFARETGNKPSFRFDQSTSVPVPGMEPYRSVTYTATLQGDVQSFLRYLESVYQLPYVVVLDSITMQNGGGIELKGGMLQITGRLYVQ